MKDETFSYSNYAVHKYIDRIIKSMQYVNLCTLLRYAYFFLPIIHNKNQLKDWNKVFLSTSSYQTISLTGQPL